jgi:hypothetical protein
MTSTTSGVEDPMSISPEIIQKHRDDYKKVTGNDSEQFVCPIMLQPVPPEEVIKGHLLNEGFFDATGQTVPQWKKVDEFYGLTAEPDLINHLNLKDKTDEDLLARAAFYVEFGDGTTAKTFSAESRSGRKAGNRFPKIRFWTGRGHVEFFVAMDKSDERLCGQVHLRRKERFYPSNWVAAGLKAAYLTLFSIFGYRVCFDPMSGALRQALASFYETRGEVGAHEHFKEFRNSFRLLGVYDAAKEFRPPVDYAPFAFDTIGDNEFLSYEARDGTHFALGLLFDINGMTVTVAVPSYVRPSDAAKVLAMYQNMMTENPAFGYSIRRVRLAGDRWVPIGQPIPHKFFETFPTPTVA